MLGCIYRSPSSSDSEFLANLDAVFFKLSLENKNVVIVGDININLLDSDSKLTADYIGLFSGFGYESLIEHPTRCTLLGCETLLDHALSNLSPAPESGVVCADITDHYPVFLIFNAAVAKKKTLAFPLRYSTEKTLLKSFPQLTGLASTPYRVGKKL